MIHLKQHKHYPILAHCTSIWTAVLVKMAIEEKLI